MLYADAKSENQTMKHTSYHDLPAETMAESVPVQLKKQKNRQRQITSVNIGTPGWTFWN